MTDRLNQIVIIAIVVASRHLTVADMAREGLTLNMAGAIVISTLVYLLLVVLGVLG